MNNFMKCDLKDGDIVKVRSGNKFVYDKEFDSIKDDFIYSIGLKDYDDYLYHLFDKNLDIVEVYEKKVAVPGRFDSLQMSVSEVTRYRVLRVYKSKILETYQPVAEFDDEKDAVERVCINNSRLKENSCYYYVYQKVTLYTNQQE